MLNRCSEAKDMSEWNEWRKANSKVEIYLQNENLSDAYLIDADLSYAHLEAINLKNAKLQSANFTHAILSGASLNNAVLLGTHFEEATLYFARFESRYHKLDNIHFEGTELDFANFTGTILTNIHFEKSLTGKKTSLRSVLFVNSNITDTNFANTFIGYADFTNAHIYEANFECADLRFTNMEGTIISCHTFGTIIKGACFAGISVNGKTKIMGCVIDVRTDFSMVNFDSAQIESSLQVALKTNIRRFEWDKYFKKHSKFCLGKISTAPMRFFWWMSDYGSSSVRIWLSILIAILFFADVYLIIGTYAPGVIVLPSQGTKASEIVPISNNYIRILCFAISTMVTLGFGGINVTINKAFQGWSTFTFSVVTLNLVLGYLFLSVLVTRFGILFQSQAPEQKTRNLNHTYFYQIALILLTIGLDIVNINNKIIYTTSNFFFNLLIVILNILTICFSFYLLYITFKFLYTYFHHKIKLLYIFSRYKKHKNTISKKQQLRTNNF